MSTVPADIAGVGSTAQRLRVSPGFDPLKAAIGPEEYFLLSRIDGTKSLREVLLDTGLPIERGISIVTRLRAIGALLLPGEVAAAVHPAPEAATEVGRPAPSVRPQVAPAGVPVVPPARGPAAPALRPAAGNAAPAAAAALTFGHDLTLPATTDEERAALGEPGLELAEPVRRRILAMLRVLPRHDPHGLLGVPKGADPRTLKRAYFALSKEIHPDRYYGKALGSFTARMTLVFEEVSRAYAWLTGSDRARAAARSAERGPTEPDQPQTPQEYAAELFVRACQLEVDGGHLDAMKLFSAAVRVDPQVRYLRRATSCALAANQPKSAVEYAKKAQAQAPNAASAARLLATAFRAAGKLFDAEEVLVMALAMKSENDVLTAELGHDLVEVRRLLAIG